MYTVLTFAPSSEADHNFLSDVAILRGQSLPKSQPITQGELKNSSPRLAFYLGMLYQALTGNPVADDVGTVYATSENGGVRGLYFPALYKSKVDGFEMPVLRWGDELIPMPFQKDGKEVTIGRESQLEGTSLEFGLSSYKEGGFTHYTLAITLINEAPDAKVNAVIYHVQIKREDNTLKLDETFATGFKRNPGTLLAVLSEPTSGGRAESVHKLGEGSYQPTKARFKPTSKVADAWVIDIEPTTGDTITVYTDEGMQEVPKVTVYATRTDIATLVAMANGNQSYEFPSDARMHIGNAKVKKDGKRSVTCVLNFGTSDKPVQTSFDFDW